MAIVKALLEGEKDVNEELRGKFDNVTFWVAEAIVPLIQHQFNQSVDPFGVPWAPIQKSTIEARKRRNISGIKPLMASGRMLSSLRIVKGRDSSELVMDSPGGFHQRGNERLPTRKIVPNEGELLEVPDSWVREIESYVSDKLLLSAK